MGDDLVDAVLISVAETARVNGIWNAQKSLRPVIDVLVNRMRAFGYDDDAIHAMLVPQEAKAHEKSTA